MRKNYNDAITVPVEVSSTQDGLFTVSEIKFEAGQEATTFSVDFPGAEVGKTYDCSIVVKDKNTHCFTENIPTGSISASPASSGIS